MTLVEFLEKDLKEMQGRLAQTVERLAALEKEIEATKDAAARQAGAVQYVTALLETVKASLEVDSSQQE